MSSNTAGKLEKFDPETSTFANWNKYQFEVYCELADITDDKKKVLKMYQGLDCGSSHVQKWDSLKGEHKKDTSGVITYDYAKMIQEMTAFCDGGQEINNSAAEFFNLKCESENPEDIANYIARAQELIVKMCPDKKKRDEEHYKGLLVQTLIAGLPANLGWSFKIK